MMGFRAEYECENCKKNWVEDDTYFYITTDEKVEYIGNGKLTPLLIESGVANGIVYETFCRDCNKDIKRYVITEIKTRHPSINPNHILEEYKHNSNKLFASSKDVSKDTEITCPNCNSNLSFKKDYHYTEDFNLNAIVYRTYCEKCDEMFYIYAINPPRKQYTVEEIVDILEKELKDENIIIEREWDGEKKVRCPVCDKQVPHENSFDMCMKCGGKLIQTGGTLYD